MLDLIVKSREVPNLLLVAATNYKELLDEATKVGEGGDWEDKPASLTNRLTMAANGKAMITTPLKEGAYRLFVYAMDGHNKVATANIPFYVKE
jgi:hypothetical protein